MVLRYRFIILVDLSLGLLDLLKFVSSLDLLLAEEAEGPDLLQLLLTHHLEGRDDFFDLLFRLVLEALFDLVGELVEVEGVLGLQLPNCS